MPRTYRFDCERTAAERRGIVQSEIEAAGIAVAKLHMREVHGRDFTAEDLRREYLEVV